LPHDLNSCGHPSKRFPNSTSQTVAIQVNSNPWSRRGV
jgi:hypothetical protein